MEISNIEPTWAPEVACDSYYPLQESDVWSFGRVIGDLCSVEQSMYFFSSVLYPFAHFSYI
jgi:hypothetical protein